MTYNKQGQTLTPKEIGEGAWQEEGTMGHTRKLRETKSTNKNTTCTCLPPETVWSMPGGVGEKKGGDGS